MLMLIDMDADADAMDGWILLSRAGKQANNNSFSLSLLFRVIALPSGNGGSVVTGDAR